MEAGRDCDFDEKSSDEMKEDLPEINDGFLSLKRITDELRTMLHQISEFQIEIKKFRETLHDKECAASVNYYSSLDTVDSVDRFVLEELEALREPRNEMDKKIEELEMSLVYENGTLLQDEEHIWDLMTSITNIQDSITRKLKNFYKNKDVKMFSQMLETKKSE